MKVLVSTGIFPNRSDTTRGVYVYQQVAALASQDAVRVIAPVPWIPSLLRSKRYDAFSGAPTAATIGPVDVLYPRYVVIPKVFRFLHGFFVYLCTLPAHARAIRTFRPDAVLSFFAYPYGFAAVLTAATFGLPVVVSCRGSDINLLARPRVRRRLIAWSLRRCGRVVAVSRALAEEIERMGVPRARIEVIPNGIDVDRFRIESAADARRRLGLAPEGRLVVCVSRLSREKGIDILVDAMARVTHLGVRAVIVGDGPEHARLVAQRDRLGLNDRIEFVGRRAHDEIASWMAAGDAVILASRTEGHPNVLVEALACGRPVVAPRVGGVPDIVTAPDLGVVVAPGDPGALAAGIDAVLSKTWDVERLAGAARARSWEHVADDLHRVLAEAAGAPFAAAQGDGVVSR